MPIESPKLDDLHFDRIVEEMIRRIPVHAPEWTDHNESDPGITMIQLFAHLAEQIGYRLNRIPEKNHIELLKLLGVRLKPARPARTQLAYLLSNPALLAGFTLPAGARAKAKAGDPPPTFETDRDVDIVPAQPVAIVTTRGPRLWDLTHDVPGTGSTPNHYLRVVWDGKSPKLAEMPIAPVPLLVEPGHEYLWIGVDFNRSRDAGFRGVRVTLTLQWDDDEQPDPSARVLCETPRPIGEPAPPQVDWLAVVDGAALAVEPIDGRIDDTTKRLAKSGTLRFEVPLELSAIAEDAWKDLVAGTPPTALDACASLARGLRTNLNTATGDINIANFQTRLDGIIHATPAPEPAVPHPLDAALREIKGWLRIRLPCPIPAQWTSPKLRMLTFNAVASTHARTESAVVLGVADGRPGQTFRIPHTNIIDGTLTLAIQEDAALGANLVTWNPVESLDSAGPFDRVFVLDGEAGEVTFGDGKRGRIPPLVPRGGNVIALRYQHGGGKAGEVAVGTVTTMESAAPGLGGVVNFVAAAGGADAETLDAAKLRARKDLSTRSRAVTAGDFEWIAKQTPNVRIARAVIVPLRRPLPGSKPTDPDDPICGGLPPRSTTIAGCQPPLARPPFDPLPSPDAPCAIPGSPTSTFVQPRCGPPLPVGNSGLALEDVPGVVSIVVVEDAPGNEPSARPSTLRKVCAHVDRHRLVTTEVHVVPPQYFRLCNFMVSVHAQPGYTRSRVQELVEARLGTYLHALSGGEDGKGFPFGSQLHVADLVANALRTEGVARVVDLSAEFSRTKSNIAPREGRLVLCPQAAGEFDRIDLAPEETVSIYLDSFTLSTVV
jgi:hypothetical protein